MYRKTNFIITVFKILNLVYIKITHIKLRQF